MTGRYFGRKLLQAIATVAAIVVLNFVLFRMMPGSPERVSRRVGGLGSSCSTRRTSA